MPRRPARAPLNVYLNSRRTGRLHRAASGAIDFRYAQEWLDWEHAFPVSLALPLREDAYTGDTLLAVFDNLLPDSNDIRSRVAARTQADGADAYSLLSAIGRDCVGALQFLPEGIEPGAAGAVDSRPIGDAEIERRLLNLNAAPLGMDFDTDFRISIAGAQDKTALLRIDGAWHLPKGPTATTHILKPQIGRRDSFDLTRSVENEHLCLRLLGALGLPVAQTEIIDFERTRALVVERFDRQWTSDGRLLRKPQEDCCQALSVPPNKKYQSDGGPAIVDILNFLKASDSPAEDQLLFFKAQLAFWLLGAIDGHAKNFSVFLYPGGGFRLTPLYDVMSVQPLLDTGKIRRTQARLAMSIGDNRHYRLDEIQPRHYYQTAHSAGISAQVVDEAFRQVSGSLPAAIDDARAGLPAAFPADLADSICDGALRRCEAIAAASD